MPTTNQPLVIAHHIMWTLYGWWLPNDPRGSTSRIIASHAIADLGELHRGRKSIQPAHRELNEFYSQAGAVLRYPLLKFAESEFASVATAIQVAIDQFNYTCYACAIMPDHVHLVIRKHRDTAEEMIQKIQVLSRERLWDMGLREKDHPVWTLGGWKVFLDHPDEVRRVIQYVINNPIKLRLPEQHWPFVKFYDNWPLHPGHSVNCRM